MNAKLIVEGKEFEIEILDPQLKELLRPLEKMRRTGYERVYAPDKYYYVADDTFVSKTHHECGIDDSRYGAANYYSDETVAANNARADKLMRQLRRFVVENRKNELNWKYPMQNKFRILYDYCTGELDISCSDRYRELFSTYFDTRQTAQQAIDKFHDELIWYFTEYKDSM